MPLPREPHLPAANDDLDRFAWKALNNGGASPDQQQRCVEWLAFATGYTGPTYVPGDTHATAFAEGKRSIMLQIDHMIRSRAKNQADTEQG